MDTQATEGFGVHCIPTDGDAEVLSPGAQAEDHDPGRDQCPRSQLGQQRTGMEDDFPVAFAVQCDATDPGQLAPAQREADGYDGQQRQLDPKVQWIGERRHCGQAVRQDDQRLQPAGTFKNQMQWNDGFAG